MRNFAKTKTLPAWIALLAFLFGVLAPAVSHALGPSPGQPKFTEICTSKGVKFVADTAAHHQGHPASTSPLAGSGHCDYCSTAAPSLAFLPQSDVVIAHLPGPDSFPTLFYQSPKPLFAWTLAKSRAPPASI
jgi:hypothetical protein